MTKLELLSLDSALNICREHHLSKWIFGNYCGYKTTFFQIEHVYAQSILIYLKNNPAELSRFEEKIDEQGYVVMVQYKLLELSKDGRVISEYHSLLDDFSEDLDDSLENLIDSQLEDYRTKNENSDFEITLMTTPMPYEFNRPLTNKYSCLLGRKLSYRNKKTKGYVMVLGLEIKVSEDYLSTVYCSVKHSKNSLIESIPFGELIELVDEESWDCVTHHPFEEFLFEKMILQIAEVYEKL